MSSDLMFSSGKASFTAAEALGEIRDRRALPALREAVNEPDERIRKAAERAIEHILRK